MENSVIYRHSEMTYSDILENTWIKSNHDVFYDKHEKSGPPQ